jgi:hypothetical protein
MVLEVGLLLGGKFLAKERWRVCVEGGLTGCLGVCLGGLVSVMGRNSCQPAAAAGCSGGR